jgi:hypothetical protein
MNTRLIYGIYLFDLLTISYVLREKCTVFRFIYYLLFVFDLRLAHGQWFSPGTPASFTTKAGRHDIAEILLKVMLNTKIKSIYGF